MSRIVGKTLSEGLGQPLIIDVQGGGAGTIATDAAARASADGYTLVVGSLSTLITGPILNPNVRYDPVKSFTPVSMVAIGTSMLLVNPGLPAKTLRELIFRLRRKRACLPWRPTPGSDWLDRKAFRVPWWRDSIVKLRECLQSRKSAKC